MILRRRPPVFARGVGVLGQSTIYAQVQIGVLCLQVLTGTSYKQNDTFVLNLYAHLQSLISSLASPVILSYAKMLQVVVFSHRVRTLLPTRKNLVAYAPRFSLESCTLNPQILMQGSWITELQLLCMYYV